MHSSGRILATTTVIMLCTRMVQDLPDMTVIFAKCGTQDLPDGDYQLGIDDLIRRTAALGYTYHNFHDGEIMDTYGYGVCRTWLVKQYCIDCLGVANTIRISGAILLLGLIRRYEIASFDTKIMISSMIDGVELG